jgi:hypothetical protein
MTTPYTPPTIRYPAGSITPHGAYYLLQGHIPTMKLRSPDNSIVTTFMGGESIALRTAPERVELKDLKGLVPPWKQIKQKGATQDGETFVTSLYDPTLVEATAVCRGRDPIYTRKVYRDLIASLDAIQTSELSWYTPEMGRWWAPVRWYGAPVDPIGAIRTNRQQVSLRMIAYDAFWRSYDNVTAFRFSYENSQDTFDYTTTSELGSGWTVTYSGAGSGTINANSIQVVNTLNNKTAVCQRVGYVSATDNQLIELDLGSFPQWFFDGTTFVDFWARMPNSGVVGANGVRLRLGATTITLSTFVGGSETVLREMPLTISPRSGEQRWAFMCGTPANSRTYKLLRNGAPVFTFAEAGTASVLGSSNRLAGFGLCSTSSVAASGILRWSCGDNQTETQTGFVEMFNVGDQEMWPRFTCFGPGTFNFGNGPGSTETVQFGPLLANQVAQVRSDPRKDGVVDMTSTPATTQDQIQFANATQDLLTFSALNLVTNFLGVFQSVFGLLGGGSSPVPPQGNLYSLLDGRFSNSIPAKSSGNPALPQNISMSITDGNADSMIIAAGTPLRRLPY